MRRRRSTHYVKAVCFYSSLRLRVKEKGEKNDRERKREKVCGSERVKALRQIQVI